jgi:hypothetical protein
MLSIFTNILTVLANFLNIHNSFFFSKAPVMTMATLGTSPDAFAQEEPL